VGDLQCEPALSSRSVRQGGGALFRDRSSRVVRVWRRSSLAIFVRWIILHRRADDFRSTSAPLVRCPSGAVKPDAIAASQLGVALRS